MMTEENYANAVLQKALYSDKEAMEKEDKEKVDRSIQYCKDLQQQLVSRQQQLQCDYEETLIEKKMLEQISRTMADEDQREQQNKRVETERLRQEMVTCLQARADWKNNEKAMIVNENRHIEQQRQDASDRSSSVEQQNKRVETERLRQEMVTCLQARADWKNNEKAMIVNEDRQIEQQRQDASDRSSSVIAERERKIQMKDELNQKIGAKMLLDEEAWHEKETNIELLQEKEYLEKQDQDDIAERAKAVGIKKDLMEALNDQMEDKKREVLKQKEVDAEFTKQADVIMAAGDQKEREEAIKIKEKARQYSLDLQQQIKDNACRRAMEHKLEDTRDHHAWDWNRDWRTEVSEERSKIVSEHASEVLGSLQAGTLAHSDLPAPREGSSKSPQLGQLDIDDMAQTSGAKRTPKCNE